MNRRKYESIYIVSPQFDDKKVQEIADHFKSVVEAQGGEVESAAKWEKRKLAYEINGFKEGNYILMFFEADGKVPAELNRQMRNSDDIIRHRLYLKEG